MSDNLARDAARQAFADGFLGATALALPFLLAPVQMLYAALCVSAAVGAGLVVAISCVCLGRWVRGQWDHLKCRIFRSYWRK